MLFPYCASKSHLNPSKTCGCFRKGFRTFLKRVLACFKSKVTELGIPLLLGTHSWYHGPFTKRWNIQVSCKRSKCEVNVRCGGREGNYILQVLWMRLDSFKAEFFPVVWKWEVEESNNFYLLGIECFLAP